MQANALKRLVQGAAIASSLFLLVPAAEARSHHHSGHASSHHHGHHHQFASAGGAHVIQCVAFARSASDVALSGNAANWWKNAEGVYARGSAPEVGSVLNFRANSRMRLGHVAVVTNVVNSRTIEIDQSHWNSRGISRDVSVVDVSENNDWTAVRVEIGHAGSYGSIYPTYGFIYARPDNGRVIEARSDVIAPRTASAPADLRDGTEVAEVPAVSNASATLLADDAPNRGLR